MFLADIIQGFLSGVISGVIPGLHINLVASVLSVFDLSAIAILCMAFAHVVVDFVPSIFLGSSSEENSQSSLPGSRMVSRGLGFDAVRLCACGCFMGVVCFFVLLPFLWFFDKFLFEFFAPFAGLVLCAVAICMIFTERNWKLRFLALFVFLLSGLFGFFVLGSSISDPLLPMFSGLFGISTLIYNLNSSFSFPRQVICEVYGSPFPRIFFLALAGFFCAYFVSLFPALSASLSTIVVSKFLKFEVHEFLVVLGSISTSALCCSIFNEFAVGKSRNGAVEIALKDSGLNLQMLLLIFACILLLVGLAVILCVALARIFCSQIHKVNFRTLSVIILTFTGIVVFFSGGLFSLLVLFVGCCLGLLPILAGVNRSLLMGSLIIPVLLGYLNF